MSLLAGLPAALTTKVAAAAAIALTAAGGGVVTKTVLTGNPNPVNWGSTVTQQVQSCKAALGTGQHGIGACVSAVASQHGQQERTAHAGGVATHATGKPPTHPAHLTGPPAVHSTGAPTEHTSGPSSKPHSH